MKINGEKELPAQISKLQKEIDRLKKSVKEKKFGLVWMNVPEAFEDDVENKLPILKEVPEKAIVNKDGKSTHILIEGDNYHALTCLNYTHKGKIDVIYIDPPYNTGDDGFRYKDKRILDKFPDGTPVPKDHPLRHSYWLSFIKKRLELAKDLLKKTGVIFISIDDNEVAQLKLLCDEIFGQDNFITNFIWRRTKTPPRLSKNVARVHDYILCYSKNIKVVQLNKMPLKEDYVKKTYKNPDNDPRGAWRLVPLLQPDSSSNKEFAIKMPNGRIIRGKWRCSAETFAQYVKDNLLVVTEDGSPNRKLFLSESDGQIVDTWLDNIATNENASKEIEKFFGSNAFFSAPKPTDLIRHLIKIAGNEQSIVLDFFVGSGTTIQAVIELNKQDDGKRQSIACTNNENNICNEVTYPRTEKVINGYSFKGKERELLYKQKITTTNFKKSGDILAEIDFIKLEKEKHFDMFETDIEDNHIKLFGIKDVKGQKEGFGGSLKYYKTAFIGKNNILKATDEDKIELAHQAGDLLSLAENTLYKVKENKFWQLYKNGERYTAVYFREELNKFDEFVEMAEKLKCPTTVYVFSWGDEEFAEEFEHIDGVKVKTIPLPILEIYKNIYNLG